MRCCNAASDKRLSPSGRESHANDTNGIYRDPQRGRDSERVPDPVHDDALALSGLAAELARRAHPRRPRGALSVVAPPRRSDRRCGRRSRATSVRLAPLKIADLKAHAFA